MVRYSLLYKDDNSKISYFYNLNDNTVYANKKQIDDQIIKHLSIYGSFVGVLLYILIKSFKIWNITISTLLAIIVVLAGVIIGWMISLFLISNTTKFFINENKKEITNEEIKKMYNKNKEFRKKYKLLLFGMIIFAIICTFTLNLFSMNILELMCVVLLWGILSVMFFLSRPICSNKLKKICNKNYMYLDYDLEKSNQGFKE